MEIRFKFRSSVDFDTIALGDRSAISVRDLRDRIVKHKNLKLLHDFDLVLSDAETGEEFEDDEFMISEGSTVVIRRIPASSRAAGDGRNSATKHLSMLLHSSPSKNVNVVNFDDFGKDLYPALGVSSANSDEAISPNKTNVDHNFIPSCHKEFISNYQNVERSNVSEAFSQVLASEKFYSDLDGNEDGNMNMVNLEFMAENMPPNRNRYTSPAMLKSDLPTELKCSLCNTIFKEAVMIPCCQHSFCDKCIRSALIEKSICPRCSSAKCGINDLLPNLSLRQAINHFPDSRIQTSGSGKEILNFVPDGESGIQGKDISCARSIGQQETLSPDSPTVTGKGSNNVMTETMYDSLVKKKGMTGTSSRIIPLDADNSAKSCPSFKKQHMHDEGMPKILKQINNSQEGGPMKLSQSQQKDKGAMLNKKRKGMFTNYTGVVESLAPSSKHRKGERKCYMCGSLDHLVRDCPAALNSYSVLPSETMFASGMPPPYGQYHWNGNSLQQVRPYAGIMMPFDPTVVPVPVTPFAAPSYMSIYSGLPAPWVGAVAPARLPEVNYPPSHAVVPVDHQNSELQSRHLNEHFERRRPVDVNHRYRSTEEYHHSETQRSREHKSESDANISRSNSSCESMGLHKKYSDERNIQSRRYSSDYDVSPSYDKHVKGYCSASQKPMKKQYSEKSNFEELEISDSLNEYKERKKHGSRSSKKHSEQVHISSIARKNHHKKWESSDDRENNREDHKRNTHKHHKHLDTDFSHKRQYHMGKESGSSRHSNSKDNDSDDYIISNRWKMI